jgi:DNA-binding CsgD family transcriptional regulator/tetratricopeptide (TPR) repeat protein
MARGFGDPVSSVLRHESRPGLFDAVYADLAGAQRPTVLVFEDIHWADETTLDLLRFLGRRLGTAPALVLATYRDDETGPDHPLRSRLGDLATQSAVSRMALAPLSLDAVTTMAGESRVDASHIWARTGGNAFFVTEVLQAGSDDAPATVADAVLARIGRLSSTARHTLTAAAVLGPRAERFVLLEVVDDDNAAVDECVSAGLLHASPVFTFRHELVRQAVLSGIGDAHRRRLNAQVLHALRAGRADQDLARLAELAENADDGAAVVEFAPAAGLRAARLGSHREAATQYARALRFALGEDERADLLQRLAVERYLTGDLISAVESGEQALYLRRVLGQLEQTGEALRWLSRFYWYSGNRAAGERFAAESLDVLTPLGPSAELAMAMSSQSQLLMLDGEHEAAIRWGTRAITLAADLDLPDVVAHAMNNVGTSESSLGIPEGLNRLRQSLQLSLELSNTGDHVARAYTNLSHHLVGLRLLEDAEVVLDEGLAYCTSHDLDMQIPYLRATRALMNVHRGRWTEAMTEATEILALRASTPIHRFAGLLPAVMVNIRTGAPNSEMTRELGQLAHDLDEVQRLAPYACVLAESYWLAGQQVTVDPELSAIYARTTSSGERTAATELAWWLSRAGLAVDPPTIRHGAFRDALTDPRSAAAHLELVGSQYDAAACLMEGNEEDLHRALEIFNRLGAKPAAAAAQPMLRKLGASKIPRGPRPTTRRDPHGLTSRQLEVLDLMAEHLTNAEIAQRLFLSERTVDHHVSAILAKLQVRTREDAIRHA